MFYALIHIYQYFLCKILYKKYTIKAIETDDEALKQFLFTLGCYVGEEIALISVLSNIYVINIKDARYSIDAELAKAIIV